MVTGTEVRRPGTEGPGEGAGQEDRVGLSGLSESVLPPTHLTEGVLHPLLATLHGSYVATIKKSCLFCPIYSSILFYLWAHRFYFNYLNCSLSVFLRSLAVAVWPVSFFSLVPGPFLHVSSFAIF